MKFAIATVIACHGLIHLLGAAKGFRLAPLPQLAQPISAPMGAVWLAAAVLFLAMAASIVWWPSGAWALGAAAIVVSTIAIVPSWSDAKAGAFVNVAAAVVVVAAYLMHGPASLPARYRAEVDRGLSRVTAVPPVTEADLAPLPPLVQRYLRLAGVVGQPRVQSVRVRMRGRIRSSREAAWLPFAVEQYNFVDPPARLFYMTGSMFLVPFQGLHAYVGSAATMRVTVAGLVPVAAGEGPEMTRAETVTLFNDMCVMAPATLIDPAIRWEPVDERRVRAAFTNAGATIQAELVFNDAGELVDFWSDDRRQAAADGGPMRAVRWSTPLGPYRAFGAMRLSSGGEARWHEPEGAYAYIEIEILDVEYNRTAR
jgi:hypothetical protein